MKTNNKAFRIVLILAIVISFILIGMFVSNRINNAAEAKKHIKELTIKVNTKSDIEILESKARLNNNSAKDKIEEIKQLENRIKKLRTEYELSVLTERCVKSQITRKIDWLEYNLNYCDNKDNLKQYKIKKY